MEHLLGFAFSGKFNLSSASSDSSILKDISPLAASSDLMSSSSPTAVDNAKSEIDSRYPQGGFAVLSVLVHPDTADKGQRSFHLSAARTFQ
jgi:hypothetical protein